MPAKREGAAERTKFVSVRITELQHDEIGSLADRDGLSVSEWLRTLIISELRLYRNEVRKAAAKRKSKKTKRKP
jgi:hypothetical protein